MCCLPALFKALDLERLLLYLGAVVFEWLIMCCAKHYIFASGIWICCCLPLQSITNSMIRSGVCCLLALFKALDLDRLLLYLDAAAFEWLGVLCKPICACLQALPLLLPSFAISYTSNEELRSVLVTHSMRKSGVCSLHGCGPQEAFALFY